MLIRTFIGGACQPDLLELDDTQLLKIAHEELIDLLGIDGQPRLAHINRQTNAMPQYHVGHLSLVQRITERCNTLPSLVLAGNALQGVGVPHCIHTAEAAAKQLLNACTSSERVLSSPS